HYSEKVSCKRLSINHNFKRKDKIMNIKNLTKEDILSQINYLEQNIKKGPAAYQSNRISRIRTLKSSLRNRKAVSL
ncbi:MAG: hypothetical protein VB054_06935, partial [Petrimonas sp.]|nr:hypothetical protein [Petrimonas sp.]MEA5063046.1 hypothetical protein [Petrimonas sp.]